MARRSITKKASLDRALDMPLAKGRIAKSSLVFNDGRAFLQIGNLEAPVVWGLGLARTAKSTGAEMAAEFSAHGSRHVHAFKDVPAEFNPEAASMAPGPAIDGQTEFGLQTDDDHEYFVSKFGDLVGVVRIKRTASGWSAGLSKTLTPRVLTTEAVKNGLMPPAGHSGLPRSLEGVVPGEYQYWKSSGPEAIAMRDALVESGFFTDETIKAVDGELRKVEVRYFLYEGPEAAPATKLAKRAPASLASRVMKAIPSLLVGKGFNPFEAEDWLEDLDKNDAHGTLAILSPQDRTTSPREMARAASTLKGAFLLEHDDTKLARAAFAPAGVVFKLRGEPSRIFCSSFAPADLTAATVLAKGEDGAVAKTIDVQGVKVQIDRPSGFVQKGTDQDGNEWSRTYSTDYGFIPRTNGGDGGSLDVFVGPVTKSDRVFWVTQLKADGSFDEYKLFMGFESPREAIEVFKAHIPQRFFGSMSEVSIGMLKSLLNLDPVEVTKTLRANLFKVAGLSYDQLRSLVNSALSEAYPDDDSASSPCSPCAPYYCEDVYDDRAIFYKDGKSYSQGFTVAGGVVTLEGTPTPVMRTWAPLDAAAGTLQMQMRASAPTASKAVTGTIIKRAAITKEDSRYALGIVLEPDIVDAQNDTYSADDIKVAFEKFAEHYRNIGLMHKTMLSSEKVSILENYIAPIDFQSGDVLVKKGTWLMGVRVNDPELWSGVKDGSITGFSIGGSAIRKPVSQGV